MQQRALETPLVPEPAPPLTPSQLLNATTLNARKWRKRVTCAKTTVVMKKEIFKPSGRTAGYRFALLNVL